VDSNLLNSPLAQWVLKYALSKCGVVVAAGATQLASHIVVWAGLASFISSEQLTQIQGGLEKGALMFGNALLAAIYAWVVHRQTKAAIILKTQLDRSDTRTPTLDLKSGALGDATLKAAALVTGVPVGEAAHAAGVTLKA
jgi:hypothetical protein